LIFEVKVFRILKLGVLGELGGEKVLCEGI